MTRWFIALIVVFISGVSFACGGDDKAESELTPSAGLPAGWPDDFPVYAGAELLLGASQTIEGVDVLSVTWEVADDIDAVRDFYARELQAGPWRATQTTNLGDSTAIFFENANDDRAGEATIIDDSEIGEATTPTTGTAGTTIVVVLGDGYDPDPDAED